MRIDPFAHKGTVGKKCVHKAAAVGVSVFKLAIFLHPQLLCH